jgi:diguanylate cyclase (GGDEF)-like protein/PAS domain S-box-containing protein
MHDLPSLHVLRPAVACEREAGDELTRLRRELAARHGQETAIAELGQAALTGVDPFILLGQACALVEMTLGTSHCRALESSGGRVLLRSALGSNATFNHCGVDGDEDESLAMITMLAEGVFTFSRLEEETRFKASHLRSFHGVRSGAAVVIRTQYGPFGVIIAYADEERTFADYELSFLRSTASIVGEAISRSRTEQALRKSEARLRQLIATTLDAVVTVDRDMNVIEWNRQSEATFQMASREVLGRTLRSVFAANRNVKLLELLVQRHRNDRPSRLLRRRIETVAVRASGEEFPAEVTLAVAGAGADATFTAFVRDISERKQTERELAQREKRFRTLVEKSWSGVVLLDANLCFSYAGSSTEHLIGHDERDLLGRSFFDYVHPREVDGARAAFTGMVAGKTLEAHGELRFRHKDGRWVWIEGFSQNLLQEPSVAAIVLNYRDVSQRKETERELEYRAHYDSLTGLPNRLLFRDRLVHALSQAARHKTTLGVLYVDLDQFKLVNDALGHSFGDLLLADVGRRLQSSLRASDTISRIGGDEFSILLSEAASTEAVSGVAAKILESLSAPFLVGEHELFITASLGVACYPEDGQDAETLLKSADAAMYRAKDLGRNQAQLFTPSMNERYVRRLALEQHLHYAIERNELELYYQPVYDRARRQITSFEALLRWHDPTRGMVAPSEFIELAEETGMIIPIGIWVLNDACQRLRMWHDMGLNTLRVAVNISAVQLQQRALVDEIRSALTDNAIPPAMLQLEITESAAMQNFEQTTRLLRELQSAGVRAALDDFGTGQSSLTYLKHFPIDTIKIDRQFVRDVTSDEANAAIVSHVISLAHTLRLNVVAEGVETEAQLAFLRHYSCDQMQGYLFSRPMPAGNVPSFLEQWRMRGSLESSRV